MATVFQSSRFVRLSLFEPCATISLAAPTLANHLGLTITQAVARLSNPPATLADQLEREQAMRLADLLAAIGVPVRLEPVLAEDTPNCTSSMLYDFSIQPGESADLADLARELALALPTFALSDATRNPRFIHKALAGPGGLVLRGQTLDQITEIRRAARRIAGLRLTASCPATALYDIILDPRAPAPLPQEVTTTLSNLGLSSCNLTCALACRVDHATAAHVVRRFSHFGLSALNRDFQRFDLFLTGLRNVSPRELADFLVIRSDLPRQLLERMPRALRIETALTRANALAFQADYAALGLETCARLRLCHSNKPHRADPVAP
ncbi:hypothetical protein [Pseudorhodobacter sp.]|uniref:hypothetical protein n=1 Tax=Pseudorhodobacter sp. TaxID=1934400 RepID=UPI00264A2BB6|nr:hypothetical protein [Pseudorhodobacter sp.]MDN5786488.1 hypothetical protein [Pseudorhodobacter sp.]